MVGLRLLVIRAMPDAPRVLSGNVKFAACECFGDEGVGRNEPEQRRGGRSVSPNGIRRRYGRDADSAGRASGEEEGLAKRLRDTCSAVNAVLAHVRRASTPA